MKNYFRQFIPFFLMLGLAITRVSYATGNTQNPILVLACDKNFGPYTGEILKTEGFNEFQMESLADAKITPAFLKKFDVVILTAATLTNQQTAIIVKFVKEGGNLIAFRPDKKLNAVFGLTDAAGTIDGAYILINSDTDIGNGLTSQTLQLHSTADEYILKGGKIIAALYKDAFASTEYPAVVTNDYGKGHAMCFSYNLPQSIAYTRQGNYQDAG